MEGSLRNAERRLPEQRRHVAAHPLLAEPSADHTTRREHPRGTPPRAAAAGSRGPDPYAAATRTRCRAAFVRFPQIRIEHHWLERLRERS